MGEFAIGQAVPRFEDPRLLRGGGRYVDDMVLPRMTFGHVLRSPHANARIRSIDTRRAQQMPGVLAVLTGADWRASGWGDLPVPSGMRRRDGSPMYRPRFPALVDDRVRWVGDYVAFVVAEAKHQAADAAELIEVDYESLPAIVSTAGAASSGAPLVWDDCADNVCFLHEVGDKAAVEAAFARAAHIVKRRLVVNRVTAAAMEPRGSIGDYNPADGRYTIYTTLQRTHSYRGELGQIIGVPESRVRVVAGDIGGSWCFWPRNCSAGRSNGPARVPRRFSATRKPAIMSRKPNWRSTTTAIFSASGCASPPRSAPTRRPHRTSSS
jgi:aerobic carbon-monoxide dehydrogenase large subunit